MASTTALKGWLTTTVRLLVAEQPAAELTVTVYVLVATGAMVRLAPDTLPVQRYTLPPVAFSVTGSPAQVWEGPLICGFGKGLMVMLNVCAVPVQLPCCGVMVMLAVCTRLVLAAVKFRAPLPLAARPIAGLLFVQLRLAPDEPLRGKLTTWPAQYV